MRKTGFTEGRLLFVAMAAFVFLLSGISATAQTRIQVSGRVNDPGGLAVIGAAVVEKGNPGNGAITDLDGNYSITVASDAVLQFSSIGYSDLEVEVQNRSLINVVLNESSEILDEAVLIGYGTVTKRSVSTAVSSIKADKISEMPNSNLAQSLVGMSSGIYLQQTDGSPGSAPSIRIRGAGSINSGNDPLYVIDGYPTTDSELFNNLNPADIAEIQIMKDAASSAIYGSKAGNGVIMVTTKQGQEGAPRVSFSAQVGISQPQNYVDVLGAADYLDMIIEARTNNGTISQYPDLIELRDSGNYLDTDWQKAIFRNALNARGTVSVTGGTDKIKYNFSVGAQDEDGIMLNSFYQKISVKGGFEAKLADWLTLGANFAPTWSKRRTQQPSGGNTNDVSGVIACALTASPILPVYQSNGDYTQTSQHYAGGDGNPDYGLNNQWRNPVANLLENQNDRTSISTVSNAYVNITPIKNLTIRSSINFISRSYRLDYYQSAYLLGSEYTGNKSTPYLNAINAYRQAGFGYNVYWSTTATYTWTLGEKHNFNFVAGYDYEYDSSFWVQQDDRTDSDNPVAYDNTNITNVTGAILHDGSSENSEYLFDALFARLIYDYNSKYVLSASIRRDRSSKFGPDNRAGIFYSASGAWNLSEEPFAESASWLDIAKLRVSYGVTGNDQIGDNYAWLSVLGTDHTVIFGTTALPSYYPSDYSNRMLGWETNRQWDLGVDVGAWGRINLTVDLYRRISDIVMPASIPNFNGISETINMNSGQIENKGIEIQLTGRPFVGEFSWESTLSWSLNRNKILSLANNQTQLANQTAGTAWGNVIRNYVGRPMGDMYMLKVIGTFNTEEDLLNNATNGTQAVGDLMYEDYNNDGTIDVNDYQLVGNYQPDFTYGWNNTFRYRNFDLALTLDGQVGGNVIYAAARAFTLNRYDDNVLAESGLGRWRSAENPGNGTSHKAGTNNLSSNISPSTRYLYDASFLRIRNLAIGYNLPANVCKKMGMSAVRVSLNFQNLWTFDNYPGYSVEANYQGNSATNNGVDFGGYPVARTMTVGLNINF